MRKILLTFLLLLGLGSSAIYAQNCTPNPFIALLGIPGVYPNPAQDPDLPDGTVGQAYSTTITVLVLGDTTIDLGTILPIPAPTVNVDVDAQSVTNVSNLPAGLSYACDPPTCVWQADSIGCLVIQGTPTAAGNFEPNLESSYGLVIPNTIPAPFGGSVQQLPIPGLTYNLVVQDNSVGMEDAANSAFGSVSNVPNPFTGSTEIRYELLRPTTVDFAVTDLTGKVLRQSTHRSGIGANTITFDGTGFAPGVYFYRLFDGSRAVTRKMVIAD